MSFESDLKKISASYIQARDPSILAWNAFKSAAGKKNLQEEFCDETTIQSAPEAEEIDDNHIKVYLRIKNDIPFNDLYEIEKNVLCCKCGDSSIKATKMYSFSRIFPPTATQNEIFNEIIKSKVLNFINGNNSTLMTYGASGSGKTFTIVGTENQPGIIPRALEYLFRTTKRLLRPIPQTKPLPNGKVEKLEHSQQIIEMKHCKYLLDRAFPSAERQRHQTTYSAMKGRLSNEPVATLDPVPHVSLEIFISFAEIYNDRIYDLLETPNTRDATSRRRLKLGGLDKDFYIKDLTEIYVTSGSDAYQLLQFGRHNLNYAATALNPNSSRSHFIFTIKLVQSVENRTSEAVVSSFSFCDLAGAERLNKTGNVGDRLKESNNINVSLSVLGRCIQAVRNGQNNMDQCKPPFRESKLTKLFQKALMGLEDISMIVNINPSQEMISETQHVLKFSAVAMEIVSEEPVKIKKEVEANDREFEYIRLALQEKSELVDILTLTVNNKNDEIEQLKLKVEEASNERFRILDGYKEVFERQRQMNDETCERLQRKITALEQELRLVRKRDPVILISSSEDEDDDDIHQTNPYQDHLRQVIEEQNQKIRDLENIIKEKDCEIDRLLRENIEVQRLREEKIKLRNENLTMKEKLQDKEDLISDLSLYSIRLSRQIDSACDSGRSTPCRTSSAESLSGASNLN